MCYSDTSSLHREYFTYPLQHLKDLKRTKKQKMKDIIKVSLSSSSTHKHLRETGWECDSTPFPGPIPCFVRTFLITSLLLSSLELSDTKVYEPQIRALLGTASHFCEVVVLKLRSVPINTDPERGGDVGMSVAASLWGFRPLKGDAPRPRS